MAKFDYLIVGAGLFGSICARELTNRGKTCFVIDKRNHIAGNCYTEEIEGITCHKYGAHIFHTNNDTIWNYIKNFTEFNNFINSPIANYHGELFNLPFNMNTFYQIWGVKTPIEAQQKIAKQKQEAKIKTPQNLEEQAISLIGRDLYEKLVKGYTEKQWGKPCNELPVFIINRLPVRFTYDNNYFSDKHQGIPIGGYTAMFERILDGIEISLGIDYFSNKNKLDKIADKIIYTGPIDNYFNFCFGPLEWRSLHFENEILNMDNYQGVAVMNYTDVETPYTRILKHKHFEFGNQEKTIITREYPITWKMNMDMYYPINDDKNLEKYRKYSNLSSKIPNVIFGGRLGEYRYYDMDKVIERALKTVLLEFQD